MLVTNLVNFKLFIMKYIKKERKKKKTINLQVHWVKGVDTQYKFNALTSNWENPKHLAPVVQKLDRAIHQINCYPLDKYYEN